MLRSTDLQGPGCQVNAGTGDALRLEPHEDVRAKAVVHVIPEKQAQENWSALGSPGGPSASPGKVTTPLRSLPLGSAATQSCDSEFRGNVLTAVSEYRTERRGNY